MKSTSSKQYKAEIIKINKPAWVIVVHKKNALNRGRRKFINQQLFTDHHLTKGRPPLSTPTLPFAIFSEKRKKYWKNNRNTKERKVGKWKGASKDQKG